MYLIKLVKFYHSWHYKIHMKEDKKQKQLAVVILHNIRSTHNVGSIFRTADAAGVNKVYLTGYTPAPEDRFGRKRMDVHKTALGAEDSVPWQQVKIVGNLIERLKKEGFFIVAVEQSPESVDYKSISLPKKTPIAFIFGNEIRGVSPQILKKCDVVAEIQMKGEKESLNVSVSAGIVLFRMLD